MEPLIVAAVVNAAGGLLNTLLKGIMDGVGRSSPEGSAKKVIDKVYDQLATAVTTNSMRVLIVLWETGSNMMPDYLQFEAAALAKAQEPRGKPLEEDIEYRMKFLQTLGLVAVVGGREYCLTPLGSAFIDKARSLDRTYRLAFHTPDS